MLTRIRDVTITATDPIATEAGPTTGTFTVSRAGSTAAALTVGYTVNGTATPGSDYKALSGSVTIPAGAASVPITVTPKADCAVEGNESVTVTLSTNPAYTVASPSSATVTIIDRPAVTVTATDPTATEVGLTTGTLTVSRTGSTATSLSVKYAVTGTATPGSDYNALSGSVTIPAGAASAPITVTPINDALAEGDETVVVTLAGNIPYCVGSPSSAAVTIIDKPILTITATDPTATEAGPTTGTFTVSRTGGTAAALTVSYAVTGTATPRSDYTALPGSVTIPAGAASASITVTPITDCWVEGNETVTVTLSPNPAYTAGTPSSATVTIIDRPVVTITGTDSTATEVGPSPGTFTVSRTGSTTAALTVTYAVTGTATPGSDYTALPGSATIPAGSASAPITVTTLDDAVVEREETVVLTLSASAAYCNGSPANATVTIKSDDGVPGLRLYDDFSGALIDPAKWQYLELVREVRGGKLVLAQREIGLAGSGPTQYLRFLNPTSISTFQAEVRLNAYTAPPGGSSRVGLVGNYYSDGSTGPGATGDVRAHLSFGGTGSGVEIGYGVIRCANADCSTATNVIPMTPIKSAAVGEVHILAIGWDGALFTFMVDNLIRTEDPRAVVPMASPVPKNPMRFLGTLLQIERPGGGGHVAGDFDNVRVNGTLYDDFDGPPFSGPHLDPSKWADLDLVREVAGGHLVTKVASGSVGVTNYSAMRYANQNAVTAMRGDVAVSAFDSGGGLVEMNSLGGVFYNDGASSGGNDMTGDIGAGLRIVSTNSNPLTLEFYAYRSDNAECTSTTPLISDSLGSVTLGQSYDVQLGWDGSVFAYGVGTDIRVFDPKSAHPVSKPPVGHRKGPVQTDALVQSAGGHAYIAASVDNVRVNETALNLPRLTPFAQEIVAGDVTSAGVGLRGTGTGAINLTGIPQGATVQRAYLYWATLGKDGTFTSPTLNSTPVAGTRIGQSDDPFWGSFQSYAYRADVTNLVHGNGTYTVAGLPAGGPSVNGSQGTSLIVIYSLPGAPSRVISVNDGAVTLAGPRLQYYATTMSGFIAANPPTGAKLTFIVGDGQSYTPDYAGLNSTLLATNEFSGSNGSYWDTRTYDVSAAMAGGAASADAIVSTGNDSLVWVAAVLSVPGKLVQFPLAATKAGTGDGTVTSVPAGINCSPTCSASFDIGTEVRLTAAPAAGSVFSTWEGACTGTSPTCVVTMTAAQSVTATFQETVPPTITHTPVTSRAMNTPITITAAVTDNVGVQEATLFYRSAGVSDYTSLAMTPTGSTYSGTIPAGSVTKVGVQYYLEAQDASGNLTHVPSTAPGTPYSVVVGTSVFTDDPLVAGTTLIKTVHITELRTAITALRTKYKLKSFVWTDPTLSLGITQVKRVHLLEMRTALDEAYVKAAKSHSAYAEVIAAGTLIKASHLNELRTYVRGLE